MTKQSTKQPETTGARAEQTDDTTVPAVFDVEGLSTYYGDFLAVRDVTMKVRANEITAFIGPSGCGKTTVLRCFNRMNDLIESARVEGRLLYHGADLYDRRVDAVEVRRRIGMVFQKPNPFPKSIYDNIAYGPRLLGMRKRSDLDDIVQRSLERAAIWDEVKDRLKASALGMSGGQQQRLCIARALAVEPRRVADGRAVLGARPDRHRSYRGADARDLKSEYSILIVTHNMQQAARVSDRTAFFTAEVGDGVRHADGHPGRVRRAPRPIFANPSRRANRELCDRAVRVNRPSAKEG